MYDSEIYHGTQVVKMHDWNEIFLIDCDMRGFNKSTQVDWQQNIHDSNLILVTELNMVALKQSDSLGHSHYPVYPIN